MWCPALGRSMSSKLGVSIPDSSKRTVLTLIEESPRLIKHAQLPERGTWAPPKTQQRCTEERGGSQRLEARPVGKARDTREDLHQPPADRHRKAASQQWCPVWLRRHLSSKGSKGKSRTEWPETGSKFRSLVRWGQRAMLTHPRPHSQKGTVERALRSPKAPSPCETSMNSWNVNRFYFNIS